MLLLVLLLVVPRIVVVMHHLASVQVAGGHLHVDGVAPSRVPNVRKDAGRPREDPPGGLVDQTDPAEIGE